MHAVVILTMLSVAFAEYTTKLGAPGVLKFVPEVFSCVVSAMVLFEGVRSGFKYVAPKYWAAFLATTFLILCGILSNGVAVGPIIAGTRFYVRALPMFLIPAVFSFTPRQIRQQLMVLAGIGVVQIPVTIYQRYVILSLGKFSGDDVRGTVMDSGVLSIMLICMVLVLVGFFMRKQIGRIKFLLLFFALLLPTTINETKATVILLPIGLLTTIIVAAPRGRRLPIFAWTAALLVTFGAALVPIYDAMNANTPFKKERHLMDFFTNEKEITAYMEAKKGVASVGTTQQVRRGDAIQIPAQYIARDPITLCFGLGVGNASLSQLGADFSGRYMAYFHSFTFLTFSVFLLEIGMLGLLMVFALYWMVAADSLAVARSDSGVLSAIAAGWVGVVAVMAVSMFYTTTHLFASLSYLYWYFSGLIAARSAQLAMESRTVRTARPAARGSAQKSLSVR